MIDELRIIKKRTKHFVFAVNGHSPQWTKNKLFAVKCKPKAFSYCWIINTFYSKSKQTFAIPHNFKQPQTCTIPHNFKHSQTFAPCQGAVSRMADWGVSLLYKNGKSDNWWLINFSLIKKYKFIHKFLLPSLCGAGTCMCDWEVYLFFSSEKYYSKK